MIFILRDPIEECGSPHLRARLGRPY